MTESTTRPDHLVAAVEALLFVSEEAVSIEALRDAIGAVDDVPIPLDWIESAVDELRARYDERDGGFHLVEVAGGWEFRTQPTVAEYVRQLYRRPAVRLSRASLEVLAVVAYRQPCTRADVEDIRGVDCSRLLRALLERGLIRIIGKADDIGRPLLYGTSPEFLEFFGLSSLGELPTLREYTELTEEHVVRLQELDETLRAAEAEAGTRTPEAPGSARSAAAEPTLDAADELGELAEGAASEVGAAGPAPDDSPTGGEDVADGEFRSGHDESGAHGPTDKDTE